MFVLLQSNSTWFSDAHTVLSVIGILLMGAMSLVGYKVHAILFDMKVPERMATMENKTDNLADRVEKLEKKVYDL